MPHACSICRKEFKYQSQLKQHLQRKTPCTPNTQFRPLKRILCPQCGKEYSSDSNMRRHLRQSCTIKSDQKPEFEEKNEEKSEENEETKSKTDEVTKPPEPQKPTAMESQMMELCKSMIEMCGNVVELAKKPSHITNNSVVVQNNITLNLFGAETVTHISPSRVSEIVSAHVEFQTKEVIESTAMRVLRAMAEEIYANPGIPENLTAYVEPAGEIMVHCGASVADKEWMPKPIEEITPLVKTRVTDLLKTCPTIPGFGEVSTGVVNLQDEELNRLIKNVILRNRDLLEHFGIISTSR